VPILGDRRATIIIFLILCYVLAILPNIAAVNAIESITFNPIADTYVDSNNPSSNYGDSPSLFADFKDISRIRRNVYLLFNLTSLTNDDFGINSATLELQSAYSLFAPIAQIGVHSCSNTQWSETEITWSNAPSFSSEPTDVSAITHNDQIGYPKWHSWNVTEDVENSQEEYLTLVLTIEGESDNFITDFGSKESSDAPRLVIEYEASNNWSEVKKISGKGSITKTAPFTCTHSEWRIRWEVEPQSGFLAAYFYPEESHAAWFESIIKMPENNETNGIMYIHDKNGSFYLDILATAETNYTLIVEENLASIPEFHSWFILPVFLITTIVVTIYRKKVTKK